MPTANIPALHAFCLAVIRRYHYLIDIDPVFRMLADGTETILMRKDVRDELREALYIENGERFFQLTMNFSNDHSDDGLTNLVFSLYESARADPDPKKWLEQLSANYRLTEELVRSRLYQEQIRPLVLADVYQRVQLYEQMTQLAQDEGLEKMHEQVAGEQRQIKNIYEAFSQDRLEDACASSEQLTFSTFKSGRKAGSEEISNEVKDIRDRTRKLIQQISKSYFSVLPSQMEGLTEKALPLVEEMTKVTQSFTNGFSVCKREKGVLDFDDLEHLALQVLTEKIEDAWLPGETSKHYRKKFKEVMAGEYQDVNQLQEAVLY